MSERKMHKRPAPRRFSLRAGEYMFDRMPGNGQEYLISKDGVVVGILGGQTDEQAAAPHALFRLLDAIEKSVPA